MAANKARMWYLLLSHGEPSANRNEFTVMIHFLKSIIDGELNIPNELTERIRDAAFQMDIDQKTNKKLN